MAGPVPAPGPGRPTHHAAPVSVEDRAHAVATAAGRAAQWIEQHGGALRQDGATMAREFRRHARRGWRLHEAAQRPMCVAIFGPSQSGKSYLVSRLAAPPGRRLAARFDAAAFDFLSEINPPGGQESTGLVTRFTIRPQPAPAAAPVTLRLLSQTDIVKILANTYLEDFDIDIVPPDAAALELLFTAAASRARPAATDALSADDIEDLAEYFDRHFRNHNLLAQLHSVGYWQHLAALAPLLPVAARAALFAPLWGGVAQFTGLYDRLTAALLALGFAPVAHCGTDALVPRETSIIDVRRLFDIGVDASAPVAATTPAGARVMLERPVLAALVAELTIPLDQQPWPFFDSTDLLDFPGARTRESIPDVSVFVAQPEKLGRAFLRGKVAYLFQRYNAEQEIAGMLLCIGPGNQDVQTLPRMLQDWIELTLGRTPEQRARQRNSLFLVLTKFDSEFEEKAGEDPATGHRWTARLQSSLIDYFGKAYDWPQQWNPGQPFDNTFWLRNPAIRFGAVFDYGPAPGAGEPAPELGVSPRAAETVAAKCRAYLDNPLVQRHIAAAATAWESALAPNDGGVGRLAQALGPVCDATLKATQVGARIDELAGTMTERLRPLWRSDDHAAELAAARARAAGVVRALVDCARAQMFGPLLRAMQITPDQVAGVHWRMQTEPETETAIPLGTVAGTDEYLGELAGLLGETPGTPAATGGKEQLDYFERFAGLVVAAWDTTLQGLAADTSALAEYRLPTEQAALLVAQIAAGARRTDLRGRIAGTLRRLASFHGRATVAGKQVLIAEDLVNGFVTYLGVDRMVPAQRPVIGAAGPGQRRIFAARPTITGLPALGAQPAAYDRSFHVDWMAALVRLMEDNVSDRASGPIDPAANEALGALIGSLAPAIRVGA